MKKNILVILIFLLVIANGFTQIGLNTGGGLLTDISFNNGVKKENAFGGGETVYNGIRNISFGGFGFFEAIYTEINIRFAYGLLTNVAETDGERDTKGGMDILQFGFSLLWKYPFTLQVITLFPIIGIDYNMVFHHRVDGKSTSAPGRFSQLGFLTGMGFDYEINSSLFFRTSALLHLRFPSNYMRDLADILDYNTTLGIGLRTTISLGYRIPVKD
ncbi:MAG: hypothetical protein FWG89_05995 [Treponema sp.]|nr:hypothetical protein [Treponema sp.]